MDLREQIARIVDAPVWAARDRAFSGEPYTPWDATLDRSMTSPSLAKADAILAMIAAAPDAPEGMEEGSVSGAERESSGKSPAHPQGEHSAGGRG